MANQTEVAAGIIIIAKMIASAPMMRTTAMTMGGAAGSANSEDKGAETDLALMTTCQMVQVEMVVDLVEGQMTTVVDLVETTTAASRMRSILVILRIVWRHSRSKWKMTSI